MQIASIQSLRGWDGCRRRRRARAQLGDMVRVDEASAGEEEDGEEKRVMQDGIDETGG